MCGTDSNLEVRADETPIPAALPGAPRGGAGCVINNILAWLSSRVGFFDAQAVKSLWRWKALTCLRLRKQAPKMNEIISVRGKSLRTVHRGHTAELGGN